MSAGTGNAFFDIVTFGLGGLLLGKDKKDSPAATSSPVAPSLPDPSTAAATADAAQTRQRQILLATGGGTDYTGGTGTLLGSDISKQTLLGG